MTMILKINTGFKPGRKRTIISIVNKVRIVNNIACVRPIFNIIVDIMFSSRHCRREAGLLSIILSWAGALQYFG